MKKLMLIVNPSAGRGGYRYYFGEAMKTLADGGFRTELFFTGGPEDATEFARAYAAEFDTVACVGGDGTLSEVIGGLMKIPNPPPIGYIPMGTTNDVASTVGLPKNDTIGAARRIVEGTPHPFDVGGFGKDRYFAYIAAFGAFTEVSYATPQDQKRALGHLAYVLQGAQQLGKIEKLPVRVEYDDGVFEGELVYGSMSNSTSVAGIVRLRDEMVSLGDGMSELVLVQDPGTIDAYGEMITAVLTRSFDSKYLKVIQTRHARFIFDRPVAWTRDGEDGGKHRELELCNYHAPVRLIF
ncbi:MAG: YegS/Rv2252/BmrU family lipid kinase [Oscillospiraceae bacterium]|nr:YegS/Rv2252/BmrU family lipid kinase [Oscillospiraceae bacterium]MBQ6609752.1 YegS/Rv2252/BmrU family lipid kinase [Oscillospiraceae bacterium]